MSRSSIVLVASVLVLCGSSLAQNSCGTGTAFFAATVQDYSPGPGVTPGTGFGIASRVLCAPGGFSDVVSLGVQGSVTVGFDHPVVNGPGTDFITWENGFEFGGLIFGELAFVEVSTDGTSFARFPNAYFGPQTPMGPFDGLPAGCTRNIAGLGLLLNPPAVTGYTNPCEGGGDAFDLDDLVAHPLVLSGAVNLNQVRYVRLVDVLGDGTTTDSRGVPVYDPTNATASSDWDAIAVVHDTLNQDAGRPQVAVAFDEISRQLTLAITEPDGIHTLAGLTLRTTFNGAAFDLISLLALFPTVSVTSNSVSLTSVPLPPGVLGSICLSIADVTGLVGADCGSLAP